MQRITIFLIVALMLAGCEIAFGPPPTATPTQAYPDLAPSPTFDIRPPTELPPGDVPIGLEGINNATAAAIAAESPLLPALSTPDTTYRPILITVPIPSGALLNGELWAAERIAPGILLIGSTFEEWGGIPAMLHNAGYSIVVVEGGLNGDYTANIRAIFEAMVVQSSINPAALVIMGVQTGADAGFVACANDSRCLGTILISPQVTSTLQSALASYNPRPVLLTASREESASLRAAEYVRQSVTGSALLQPFEGAGSGVQILHNRPDMVALITTFLSTITGG